MNIKQTWINENKNLSGSVSSWLDAYLSFTQSQGDSFSGPGCCSQYNGNKQKGINEKTKRNENTNRKEWKHKEDGMKHNHEWNQMN